jgi:hypothetical protein
MGISDAVRSVVDAILRKLQPQNARQRLLAELLRLMPLYRDFGDLSAWEVACRQKDDEDDNSEIAVLLREVHDFAILNMYASIDVSETKAEYARLSDILRSAGVEPPVTGPLTDW